MNEMIEDKGLCRAFETVYPDLDRVLAQLQLDLVTPANTDSIGGTLLGVQAVRDTILLFTQKGKALRQQSEQSKQ